jgi:hypothetical protein
LFTVFTTARPFTGEFAVIQWNAIASWTRLHPDIQVLVLGDEDGVAGACAELGVEHVPKVDRNEFGTPLLNSMIALAELRSRHSLLALVAADTILFSDMAVATERVAAAFTRFCVIAGRYHAAVGERLNFDASGWEAKLRSTARPPTLAEVGAGDVFLYTRGLWGHVPPFATGRTALDNWLLYHVLKTGAALVDVTPVVTTLHQDHERPGFGSEAAVLAGPEAGRNRELAGGRDYLLTRENATHVLYPDGIGRPPRTFRRHIAWAAAMAALRPSTASAWKAYRRTLSALGRLTGVTSGSSDAVDPLVRPT